VGCSGGAQRAPAAAKHLTAETKTDEFVAGKGTVVSWERLSGKNHWFDALYNACAAGHGRGLFFHDRSAVNSPVYAGTPSN
jgi:hypothetical protein